MSKIRSVLTDKTLWIILSLSCVIRLYIWHVTPLMAKDGVFYIDIARHFIQGNFYEGLQHPYHPLYPMFISLGSTMGIDFETSGRLISLIFGTSSVAIIYIFGKKIFDSQIAFLSAAILAFHPYAARLSANVRCDSMYLFFYLLGFGLGYRAIVSKRSYVFFLTGMVSALAYLTRPEGISIIVILSIWIGIQLITGFGKSCLKNNLKGLCLLFIGFLIFSMPYIGSLRCYNNSWMFTQKKQVSDISGVATIKDILYNSQNEETNEQPDTVSNKLPYSESLYKDTTHNQGHKYVPHLSPAQVLKSKHFKSFYKVLNVFLITLHYPFFIFFTIGIIYILKDPKTKIINFYILSYIILFLFILYFLHVSQGYLSYRHLMNVVLIVFFWTGIGINKTYSWLIGKFTIWQYSQPGSIPLRAGVIFLCLIMAFFLPKTLRSSKWAGIYKDAGVWIQAFYPDVPIILTNDARVAFYANTQRVEIPRKSSYEEIIAYARLKKIDLIVVTNSIIKDDPAFFSKIGCSDLKKVYKLSTKGRKVAIYQVVNVQLDMPEFQANESYVQDHKIMPY
jgi:4-amino-4-deoxy-L-arabinose transferase-like glycosyltransferase